VLSNLSHIHKSIDLFFYEEKFDDTNNMNKRNTFFKQVARFINEHSIGQIILAEDYNDILSKIDTKKIYQSKKFDKPVHNLKSMIK